MSSTNLTQGLHACFALTQDFYTTEEAASFAAVREVLQLARKCAEHGIGAPCKRAAPCGENVENDPDFFLFSPLQPGSVKTRVEDKTREMPVEFVLNNLVPTASAIAVLRAHKEAQDCSAWFYPGLLRLIAVTIGM